MSISTEETTLFNVIGGWTAGNLAYWDGKDFTKNEENKKAYKVERAAVAVARKLRATHQAMRFEVVNETSGKTTQIIVVKDGTIYCGLPKEWERLKAEGFTR